MLDAEAHPEHARRVRTLLQSIFGTLDATTLLADFGFSPRSGFSSEFWSGLRTRLPPPRPTPATSASSSRWCCMTSATPPGSRRSTRPRCSAWAAARRAADAALARRAHRFGQMLASQIRAVALSAAIRPRLDPALLADRPFFQLAQSRRAARRSRGGRRRRRAVQQIRYLRALLSTCRRAIDSVREHPRSTASRSTSSRSRRSTSASTASRRWLACSSPLRRRRATGSGCWRSSPRRAGSAQHRPAVLRTTTRCWRARWPAQRRHRRALHHPQSRRMAGHAAPAPAAAAW